MYIESIKLTNIRCFDRLVLDLKSDGRSILIAGDNGDGKSTIHRSIAMGLCDESSAAALLRELPGEFVRKGQNEGTIEVYLRNKEKKEYIIITKIIKLEAFETVKQVLLTRYKRGFRELEKDEEEQFPWHEIFVSGYGAGARTQGTADYQHYLAVDAVYPLFKYEVPLQNPELLIRRLIDRARNSAGKDPNKRKNRADKMWNSIQELLVSVLNLKRIEDVKLTSTGLSIKHNSHYFDIGEIGDGYKATTTWVLDLISWRMLDTKRTRINNISGIVLLDEVEQHLHPRWQRDVMEKLQSVFPKVQFIATTHSPLVASGNHGIPVLPLNISPIEARKVEGWLAEDVYRDVMGLPTTRDQRYSDLIEELQEIYLKTLHGPASMKERDRMMKIRSILNKNLPDDDPVVLTSELASLRRFLKTT